MKIISTRWRRRLRACTHSGAVMATAVYLVFSSISTASAEEAIIFTVENDTFTGSDNNYTNGFGLTWVSNDVETYPATSFNRKWASFWGFLPFVLDDGYETYSSWTLAQEMHTPDDIEVRNPPQDDQPYAGVLYVDNVIYMRKERWAHAWALKLGVVGSASQADHTQKKFHELVGGDEPRGWDTQLPNEPVINAGLTTTHLLAEGAAGGSARWRLVPVGNVSLGTYFTGAGLGLYGEVGWNLADALGGTALREGLNAASTVGVGPVDDWSVSFFLGGVGYGVLHYLPLDGTVFRSSQSVDSEPFIGMGTIGVSVRRGRFAASFANTFYTETFETELNSAEFGTVSLSWFH